MLKNHIYLQSWNPICLSTALPPCPWNLATLLQPTITSLVIAITLFLSFSQTEAQVSDLGPQAQLLQFPLTTTWPLFPCCSDASLNDANTE